MCASILVLVASMRGLQERTRSRVPTRHRVQYSLESTSLAPT